MKEPCSYCGEVKRVKRLSGSVICRDCYKGLPFFVRKETARYFAEDVTALFKHQEQSAFVIVSPTARYGKMFVDEKNGILGIAETPSIAKSILKNKKPIDGYLSKGAVFIISLFDLDDIGLCCKDPKGNNGQVICDVELYIRIDKLGIDKRIIAKTATKCPSKKVDKFRREWDEPGELSMFRNILKGIYEKRGQIISDSFKKLKCAITNEETRAGIEFFGLSERFSAKELKSRRNFLVKVFHPDLSEGENDIELRSLYTKKVNELYKRLLPYAAKEEKE